MAIDDEGLKCWREVGSLKAGAYMATGKLLREAARDPSLSDAAFRQLAVSRFGDASDEIIAWADSVLAKIHASDCAVNNAPALPVGPCDCGVNESK